MAKFHNLKIKDVRQETDDCVSISFEIPLELKDEFQYKQGQYVTIRKNIDGEEIRRSYSACSSPIVESDLRIAVKKVDKGRMSGFLNNGIEVGESIEVMKPMGNFYTEMPSGRPKNYVAFAAGSGITPIMSLLKTALASDEGNRFTLFYGNKSNVDIIFKEELDRLEGEYPERLKVVHVLSREQTEDPLFSGRISTEKCNHLINRFPDTKEADEYFICGPFDMIKGIEAGLMAEGIDKHKIHFELFTTKAPQPEIEEQEPPVKEEGDETAVDQATVTIVLDGEETEITVRKDESILDAALDAGLDAPYACTGGSCCTCRAKLISGHAIMEVNYALTDQEVEDGYILTCQSHPTTKTVVVDYDEP